MSDLDLREAVVAAYHGWREGQRCGPLSPGEFEATYSRMEAAWMAHALAAAAPLIEAQVRAQVAHLAPFEDIALTVAAAQVRRGEEPTPNVAAVCVMALLRIARGESS